MKKITFVLIGLLTAFILSCGGSEGGNGNSQKCEKNLDCPMGKICSGGLCVSPEQSEVSDGGSSEELPDDSEGGNHGGHDGGETASDDDTDTAETEEPITGTCTPGKTQKCEYQGPEETENVGPCKAAVRTCKEDGTWGKCEGEVLPGYEESGQEICTNGLDDDCDGEVDNKTGSCSYYWHTDPTDPTENPDSDGIDVGYTGDYSDAYQIPADVEPGECTETCVPLKAECIETDVNEGTIEGLCNGLDDDCDGEVDEGCSCSAGQTQPCFAGPPNFRNKGTCQDGVQTCKVSMRGTKSVGVWGDCVGGISPKQDVCDFADNNCNGCNDEKLCCAPAIDCSFDIGVAQPFNDKIIDGTQIYDTSHQFNDAESATWEWTLTKGPCDIVLGTTSFATKGATTAAGLSGDGTAKASVSGVGLSQFKVKFQLSGNYVLHLKVTRPNGEVYECEWVLKVVSDGLRIELCWDTHSTRDIDLHLGKNGVTTDWTGNTACYYAYCKGNPEGTSSDHSAPNWNISGWGYAKTMNYNKQGHWVELPNPRLDIDNIADGPVPENINLDNPNNGDTFRVGVKYFSNSGTTHPVINVYCGGTLKATYGVEPQVSGFTKSPYFWKVVEIKWVGDYASDACELTPRWNEGTGYVVDTSVPSYNSSTVNW